MLPIRNLNPQREPNVIYAKIKGYTLQNQKFYFLRRRTWKYPLWLHYSTFFFAIMQPPFSSSQ